MNREQADKAYTSMHAELRKIGAQAQHINIESHMRKRAFDNILRVAANYTLHYVNSKYLEKNRSGQVLRKIHPGTGHESFYDKRLNLLTYDELTDMGCDMNLLGHQVGDGWFDPVPVPDNLGLDINYLR